MKTGSRFQPLAHHALAPVWLAAWLVATSALAYSNGTNYTFLASFGVSTFGSPAAQSPFADLVAAQDGNLYGTTELGGTYGAGTVFKLGPLPTHPDQDAMRPTVIFSFAGTNGSDPRSPLVVGPDGNLYGTTYKGGANNCGTIFQITPGGQLTTLGVFNGTNGALPCGNLAFNTNFGGAIELYGTTYSGGGGGSNGVLFRLTFNGGLSNLSRTNLALVALFSFDPNRTDGNIGTQPCGGVSMGPDGNLYGTTQTGGLAAPGGLIFMYELPTGVAWSLFSGGMNNLYDFAGTDGTNSQAALTLGPDLLTFYGTCAKGGSGNAGTIFSLAPMTNGTSATVTRLWDFGATGGGSNCVSRLLAGADNKLYGTTKYGGTSGHGTVFACTTNGSLLTLWSFQGGIYGSGPLAGLAQSTNGNFYGVTPYGGTALNNPGCVFELWGFPPYIVTFNPTNTALTVVTNTSQLISVSAGGTGPLTYHWQQNGNSVGAGGAFSGVTTTNLTISPGHNTNTYKIDVVVNNLYGSITSSTITISVANSFGTNVPIVATTNPRLNKDLIIPTASLNVNVSGTVSSDYDTTISAVFFRLNGSAPQQIQPTASQQKFVEKWTAAVRLTAGTNVFQVYAQDSLGHYSLTNTTYLVPSLFVPAAGKYSGLFWHTNGVINPTNAGFFTLNLTTAGACSGTLQLGGVSYSMSGKMGSNGVLQATAKGGKGALLVTAWVDFTPASNHRIFGVINQTNSSWQATLAGDLAMFETQNNPCPWYSPNSKFNYALSGTNLTLLSTNLTLPGTNFSLVSPASNLQPPGGGYGAVSVSSAGLITFSGTLSDGTGCSQSVPISTDGFWPLYVSLYGGQGMLWGWQKFPSVTDSQGTFAGDVAWMKPPGVKGTKNYNGGFTVRAVPQGAYYSTVSVSGQNLFGSTSTNAATFIAIGGDFPVGVGITNQFTIAPNNKVSITGLDPDLAKLSLSFSAPKGTFSGSFTTTGKKTGNSFNGAVLLNTNSTGFFTGTNQNGQVWITLP